MEHGGLLSFTQGTNDIIDFSSNINPLGVPPCLKREITNGFNLFSVYPDIRYGRLKKNVSHYLQCKTENILLGNGAVELIDNFCAAAKRIIICPPCFSEYGLRAKARSKPLIQIPYLENFTPDIDGIAAETEKDDLLILGNPNNPTGLRLKRNELLEIYGIVKNKNAVLLLDEVFFEFCPETYDSIKVLKKEQFKNAGIIRAATKFFALPGIRLAYACTSEPLVNELEKLELPWHINAAAELAGNVIFNDMQFIETSKAFIKSERMFLLENLKYAEKRTRLPLKPYASDCNFILLKLLEDSDTHALEFFLKKNILVRTCSNFGVLGNNHIRIAVKSRKDNTKLIKAIDSAKDI